MVEANTVAGDGVNRHIEYARWREDKAPSEGYSRELISVRVIPKHYDDLDLVPHNEPGQDTIIAAFKKNVQRHPNDPFLGTRPLLEAKNADGKPTFGPYEWKTFAEVNRCAENLAKGLMTLDLCQPIIGEEQEWRFCGIWAKNRWEWTATLLACMHYKITTIGFYDAMSLEQVEFILNQTEMQTLVCSEEYAAKLITLRKQGQAQYLKTLIATEDVKPALLAEAQELGIDIRTFASVMQSTENAPAFIEADKNDVYIFSYTSGTTGDSKGVKLTHNNILSNSRSMQNRLPTVPGETMISYLPYTHSFEQALFGFTVINALKIGFFTGDAQRLVDDVGVLAPQLFPSVPRLYNRIYSKLKSRLEGFTGCKRWLADKAVAAKEANYAANGAVTHGCYDSLVFKKMKALLGGNVRAMVTGSAPIDKAVIDFLKICFCCPIVEGYGLTESSAASCVMDLADTVTGHVGGPNEALKVRLKDLPEMSYLSSDKPYPRGEICMTGPSIFSGYYKRPDKTAEAFDAEGWFQTGDVGMIYPNGSIKIIDRSKNIFKLSQGEYIAPEKIEQIMQLSQLIAQCFLYGDSFKNSCVAVVIPEEEWVAKWAQGKGLGTNFSELCKNADLKKEIGEEMARLAKEKKLSSLEKPKEFMLHDELFSIENNMLTSTFKVKRNVAKDHLKPMIDEMYEKIAAVEASRA